MRCVAVTFLALWLTACSTHTSVEQDARVAFAGSSDQYVVITVHNRQSMMPRAGSTPRDYDSNASYGVSPAARKELRALAGRSRHSACIALYFNCPLTSRQRKHFAN
jgi:hypothetical protein